jgi:uncharacterized protein (DUF2267 family)
MREELIGRVVLHGGLTEEQAHATVVAVLGALRRQLGRTEAEALADELPADLAEPLRHGQYAGGDATADVAAAEHVAHGVALEHVATVCRALAESLPEALTERLRRALPPATAALFAPSPPATSPEPRPHATPHRDTLAQGRAGSRHPLSEAQPSGAQSESVVASDNPHGDTKLSSSHGLTQERERESLATGHPRAHRTLADPDED